MEIRFLQVRETLGDTVTSPRTVADIMKDESKADRECMWVLHLNTKNMIIEKELVSVGILNASLVSPREVFRKAVINSSCSIIAVHNHLSGDAKPSTEDKQILSQLEQSGNILGIPLIDFIIISPSGKHWSAKEEGLIIHP